MRQASSECVDAALSLQLGPRCASHARPRVQGVPWTWLRVWPPGAHICLVSLGTGVQNSQMIGMGTGLEEAKTVSTSQIVATGMIMSAGGPTAGSVRQS